jgi:putative restriction endonuclease
MSLDQRNNTLAEFARFTGRIMPAAFLQNTAKYIPGVDRIHPLMSGIYKPAWSEYALCIKMAPGSPYERKDEVIFLDDGRWLMTYSPRSGGLEISDNRALVRCMDDHMPLAVIQQVTDKTKGSTYKVLGLGVISGYDPQRDVFNVESADLSTLAQVSAAIEDEKQRYEVVLYAELTNEFRPFMQEDRVSYVTSLPKRDEAFREVLLTEYDFACAICGMKFKLGDLHEAQAAHIVPKNKNGTDDPRNGLTLCRAHHWAFDAGLFTLTPEYTIVVSSLVQRADTRKFELLSLNQQRMHIPQREVIAPHHTAIEWHQAKVFRG